MECLKKIDKFGLAFNFRIDGGTLKTSVGGFLTIIVVLSAIVMTLFFGIDIFLREDPTLSIKSSYHTSFPILSETSGIKMVVSLIDSNGLLITDERFIEYVVTYVDYEMDNVNKVISRRTIETFPLQICKKENFDPEVYNNETLSHSFCNDKPYKFGGDFSEKRKYSTFVYVKYCDLDTEKRKNLTCKNVTEEFRKYKIIFFTYYITHTLIDPTNYKNPFSQVLEFRTLQVPFPEEKKTKIDVLKYSKETLVTDTGVISPETKSSDIFQFFSVQQNYEFSSKVIANNIVSGIQFESTKFNKIYQRKYVTIPDIISSVGGFLSFGQRILLLLFSYYSENKFILYLTNQLFQLEVTEPSDNDNTSFCSILQKMKDIELTSINRLNLDKKSEEVVTNDNKKQLYYVFESNLKSIERRKLERSNKIAYSLSELGKYLWFPKLLTAEEKSSKKTLFFYESLKMIEKKLDVANLYKELNQLSLMRKMLLNDHQNFILDNNRRIVLRLETEKDTNFCYETRKDKLIAYLNEYIKHNNDIRYEDLYLIEMTDQKLKDDVFLSLKFENVKEI